MGNAIDFRFLLTLTLSAFLWASSTDLTPLRAQELPEPTQKNYLLTINSEIQAVALYETQARVLSKQNYSKDKEAEYSPTDLALGWGRLNESHFYDQLDFAQDHRWFTWRHSEKIVGITKDEIMVSATNIHMIPGTLEVAQKLKQISKGDIVRIKGYLVNIKSPKGWVWRTSKTRCDSGAGACEIVYATEIDIVEGDKKGIMPTVRKFLGLD